MPEVDVLLLKRRKSGAYTRWRANGLSTSNTNSVVLRSGARVDSACAPRGREGGCE